MRLVISPMAEQDIEEIGDYIALDNPARALSFIEELYQQCRRIGETPKLYRRRDELGKGVREGPYGRYLIVFSNKQDEVRIERVLHMARDPGPHFAE